MNVPMAAASCFAALAKRKDAWRATYFLSEKKTVKVTAKRYGKLRRRFIGEYAVTVGKPNYLERMFIRACKKAGESLPLRRVQLKLLPKIH